MGLFESDYKRNVLTELERNTRALEEMKKNVSAEKITQLQAVVDFVGQAKLLKDTQLAIYQKRLQQIQHEKEHEKMVKEMLDSGLCTVGSHSLTHSILRKMSQDSVEKEFVNSRVELSRIFNTNVDILAYPFGSVYACSKDNIKAAQNTEYQLAFSTLNCHLTENNMLNRFFIPRKNVNENNYKEILRCWNAVN